MTEPDARDSERIVSVPSSNGVSPAVEVLVRVEGVSKKFCRNLKKSLAYGLRDVLAEMNPFGVGKGLGTAGVGEGGLRPGEFWANRGISFELRRGECLGIIGHNGAGKTTLLKMLNGLIKPDEGRIEMRGRVGALIALGAGFNPILTGRENIYVNGSILGLRRKEIDAKIGEIIEFSGIRDFIDAPVQSYSSGMQVRLGFSVAVNLLRPDVLILDEVLAVGDNAFRIKCLNKVAELSENCATLFISHDALQVSRICHRVIWLQQGRLIRDTREVDATLSEYSAALYASPGARPVREQWSHQIDSLKINGQSYHAGATGLVDVRADEPITLGFRVAPLHCDSDTTVRVLFLDEAGNGIAEVRSTHLAKAATMPGDAGDVPTHVTMAMKSVPLADGVYNVRLVIGSENSVKSLVFVPTLAVIKVSGHGQSWCKSLMESQWRLEPEKYRFS